MASVIEAAITRYTQYGEINLTMKAFPRPVPSPDPFEIVGTGTVHSL